MAVHVDFRSESRLRRADNLTFMPRPLPLVTTVSGQSSKFRINPEARDILQDVVQPITVIGIAGRHREGKSYLANWLLGEETGFPISSSYRTETKGIWFWCRPHPYNPDSHLIVLDTEGLEDPAKGDLPHDINIFTLTVLMASCFILNSRGTIGDHSIQILRYPFFKNVNHNSNALYGISENQFIWDLLFSLPMTDLARIVFGLPLYLNVTNLLYLVSALVSVGAPYIDNLLDYE